MAFEVRKNSSLFTRTQSEPSRMTQTTFQQLFQTEYRLTEKSMTCRIQRRESQAKSSLFTNGKHTHFHES